MSSLNLIERMLAGETVDQVLESAGPPSRGPFAIRKYVRQTTPALYAFLDDRGDLHDFSLRLVSGNPSVKDLIKKQNIPIQFKPELEKLLAGLEEN